MSRKDEKYKKRYIKLDNVRKIKKGILTHGLYIYRTYIRNCFLTRLDLIILYKPFYNLFHEFSFTYLTPTQSLFST